MSDPATLLARVTALRDAALQQEQAQSAVLATLPLAGQASARNLIHHLALRGEDLRPVQAELGRLGINRLTQCEGATLAMLEAVLHALHALAGQPSPPVLHLPPIADGAAGSALLATNTTALFGPRPADRQARIMVTMSGDMAVHPTMAHALLVGGMDLARISCAHDEPATWVALVQRLRAAMAATGRTCRIQADLAGPRLRTGPVVDGAILLLHGDRLLVTAAAEPGIAGGPGGPARIACSIPAVLQRVQPGERIWFDEGRLGGRVVAGSAAVLEVVLDHVRPGGARLKAGKSIHLPQTDLGLAALTTDDRAALRLLAPHLDLVGLSFLRRAEDVTELDAALRECGRPDLGRVLKIENATAVRELPRILGAALRTGRSGIMVARGDLAVELGFERLAETQDDILAQCEAAHLPAIWATQVLERMAKKGLPTRAELTDAAQSIRAECVLLNKGPFIVETLGFLADVLRRSENQHGKRRPPTGRLATISAIG